MKSWVMIQRSTDWQVGCVEPDGAPLANVEIPPGDNAEQVASRLAAGLGNSGYRGEPVALLLASERCLAATIQLDGPVRARSRTMLAYELEQWLPLCAEEMVADYVLRGHRACGVAIELGEFKLLVEALEAGGVVVQSMTPLAVAAAQWLIQGLGQRVGLVVWQEADRIDVIQLDEGHLAGWHTLANDTGELERSLLTLSDDASRKPTCWQNVNAEIRDGVLAQFVDVTSSPGENSGAVLSLSDAALSAAGEYLAGTKPPWIELRRDALGSPDRYRPIRKELRWSLAAFVLLVVAAIGSLQWRASRYERLAATSQVEQEKLFRQVFLGQRVPAGIRRRLESEYARLAGLSGTSAEVPRGNSALSTLYSLLEAVPADGLYRITAIRIERARIVLDGEVRTLAAVQHVSEALRKAGFEIETPRNEQLPNGSWTLNMTAELKTQNSGATRG